MTHNTDAERAEFEAWAKSENMNIGSDCDGYIHADTAVASMAWQAARRAKVVPSDVDIAELRLKYGITSNGRGIHEFENVASFTRDALARWSAAHKPLEAHVELPEPDAWRYTDARGHFRYRGARPGFAVEYPLLKPEALYTEKQVRELLADHGIGKDKA